MDQLSEVFDLIEVRNVLSDGFVLSGPWVAQGPLDDELKVIASVSGRVELLTDGIEEPLLLQPGDVAVLNCREWLRLSGGVGDGPPRELAPETDALSAQPQGADRAGADNVLLGGRIELSPAGRTLMLQALPPVGIARTSMARTDTAANVSYELDRIVSEMTTQRMGAGFAVRQRAQLLLLEVLRAFTDRSDLPPGWLRLLADERLRPALALMHEAPGRSWRLEDLAHAAAMSRTTFALRFRTVAGMTPLAYLGYWRMLKAQRALHDNDTGLRSLALCLGYASESAFSSAFKRIVGEAPAHYRDRLRRAK